MALQWVKENIADFGGDPERITIFGISAGGWSVSAHMVSPLSKGLFTRAISQSGSFYGYNLESRTERAEKTKSLARSLDCPDVDHEAMLTCLRQTPATELHDAAANMRYLPFGCATYGDDFLPLSPKELYDSHQIHPEIDYIMGVTSEEGAWAFVVHPMPAIELATIVQEGIASDHHLLTYVIEEIKEQLLRIKSQSTADAVEKMIRHLYFPDLNDKISNLRGTLDAFSDILYVAPTVGTATRVNEAGSKVYLYQLDQTPGIALSSAFAQLHLVANEDLHFGCNHALDLLCVCIWHCKRCAKICPRIIYHARSSNLQGNGSFLDNIC